MSERDLFAHFNEAYCEVKVATLSGRQFGTGMKTRTFFFIYLVATKPKRWVHDLMLQVEAADSQLNVEQIKQRVTHFLNNGDNPSWLRELRGDISLDYCREINAADWKSSSEPVHREEGLRIFAPIRGLKETID